MGNQNQKPQPKQQQQEDDDQNQQETFTCEICIEPVNRKFKNSNKCVHPFCTDCIQKYIKHKLQENVSDIRCPAINCNHSLEILSCRPKIKNQVFNKWSDVLCESLVVGFSRVYCPNVECSELILDECGDDFDGRLKRCVCPQCGKPFCFRCKVPWHGDDNPCRDTLDENDAAFNHVYKKNKWKRCPNCKHCIEHVGGCESVRCRCGVIFNYRSGIIEFYGDDLGTRSVVVIVLISLFLVPGFIFFLLLLVNLLGVYPA